jgi:hypothetical protein
LSSYENPTVEPVPTSDSPKDYYLYICEKSNRVSGCDILVLPKASAFAGETERFPLTGIGLPVSFLISTSGIVPIFTVPLTDTVFPIETCLIH